MRNFEDWLNTFTESISTYDYYVDNDKIYKNVDKIEDKLNLLNGLIGKENIEEKFIQLLTDYPKLVNVIPILIAVREKEIFVRHNYEEESYKLSFKIKHTETIEDYIVFMRETGLFDLLQNHIISDLKDYVTGVETGLDTNARKNRTGHIMEDLVELFIQKAGFVKGYDYFKEMPTSEIKNKYGIDLTHIKNKNKAEKRFDFVIYNNKIVYCIETNFYNRQGSKLTSIAGDYIQIVNDMKNITNAKFVWITDGKGWKSTKKKLNEAFSEIKYLYNINDMKNNKIFEKLS